MTSDVQTKLNEAKRAFDKACEQIKQLNRRLDEMAKRYDKASKENHRSFRYSLRLRMAVTEGVRNMYYEYASNKADEITTLRHQDLHDSEMGSSEEENSDFAMDEEEEEEEEPGVDIDEEEMEEEDQEEASSNVEDPGSGGESDSSSSRTKPKDTNTSLHQHQAS